MPLFLFNSQKGYYKCPLTPVNRRLHNLDTAVYNRIVAYSNVISDVGAINTFHHSCICTISGPFTG